MSGKLYICPTPIGNLEDMTYRTIRILNEVDLIAAEDTRHSIKLLNHFEISKPLTSYHEHNKDSKGGYLINKLLEGENIALISDAGMPGISDPGEDIIKQAIENNIEIEVLPGATASITALVGSGLETAKFAFEGFLDRDKKVRRNQLEELKEESRTIIFYESPHRLKDTLKDMLKVLGNRRIAVNREITKKYQEIIREDIETVINIFNEREVKGEFVLIVEGFKGEKTVVIIGDNTTLRECVTVNRGTASKGQTVIGRNCLIMAYSHIAHDCVLKDNVIIGNASQIAGEVEIDDFAIVSGGSLVHQFTRISKHVMVQGGSRIGKDIPPYTLIGRDPIVYCGINIVGLRRRGFTNQQVYLIQDIYRTLYTRGLNNSDALKAIETEYEPCEERDLILNFIKSSKRGIVRGSIDEL